MDEKTIAHFFKRRKRESAGKEEETRDHDPMPDRHEKETHKTKTRKDGKP